MAKQKQELSMDELLEQALVPEAEQPHEVPGNWVWTKLEQVAKWGSGGTPSRKNPNFYVGDIPWVKTGELNDGYIYDTKEKISAEAIQKSSAKIFPVNTVVIAMYGATIGKVSILGIEATTNQACACAVTNEDMLFKYLFYFLADQKEAFIKKGKGGAQPNISQEIIKQHKIPLPPLAEQQRIVDRIESLFAKLDKAKELVQNALDSFANRKAAILHQAFSGELTANWRKEHGIGIDSWKEKTVGDLGNVKGGKRLPKGESLINENTGYPYIKAGDLKNGTVVIDNIQFITEEIHEHIKNYTVKTGDVYITIVGACIGDVGVIPDIVNGANLTENAAKITNLNCNSSYLGICLSSLEVQRQIKDKISSATLGKLSLLNIKSLIISIPSIDEQCEIIHQLKILLESEQKAQALTDVIEKINLMKKSILAHAFRGELDTNDPSEENAKELLKKVLQEKL